MNHSRNLSDRNYYAFLWHAAFLAFAQNFMDVDTVIPSMIIESGGGALHIGIMTTILLGGSSFTQLFFAPLLSNVAYKKKYLLLGINARIFALFALGIILLFLIGRFPGLTLWFIFFFITLFALAGAFTNISYTDILGKSVGEEKRKHFFSAKQVLTGVIMFFSAFLAKRILTTQGFPVNYGMMFFLGGALLLVASGGFWKIKEFAPSAMKINGFRDFIRILKRELSQNPKLVYFLGFINTQGIIISFLPFVVLYAREALGAQSGDTGFFLLFKVVGMVSVSLLIFLSARKIRYNNILYLNFGLSLLMIGAALLVQDARVLRYLFVLGGVIFSLYSISMNGVLLEISGKENRAIYTGFAGAGNILPALFPLTGSFLIGNFGFRGFFLFFMVIVALSFIFIRKIDCKK